MGSKPGASTVVFCFQVALKPTLMQLAFQKFFQGEKSGKEENRKGQGEEEMERGEGKEGDAWKGMGS